MTTPLFPNTTSSFVKYIHRPIHLSIGRKRLSSENALGRRLFRENAYLASTKPRVQIPKAHRKINTRSSGAAMVCHYRTPQANTKSGLAGSHSSSAFNFWELTHFLAFPSHSSLNLMHLLLPVPLQELPSMLSVTSILPKTMGSVPPSPCLIYFFFCIDPALPFPLLIVSASSLIDIVLLTLKSRQPF